MSIHTAPSQIAQRQLAYFEGKHVLLAGELEDDFCLELSQHCASVSVFTTHFGFHQKIKDHAQISSYFGAQLIDDTQVDLILFYWPKAKAEAEYLLAMLFAKFGKGTEIIVVGENRSGVKSIERFFEPYGTVKKYDSARRCSFYWGECHHDPKAFNINDWFMDFTISVDDLTLQIKSLPGVFSRGELDLGTQLLLENLFKLPKLQGKILDVGCGAGIIGASIAKRHPETQVTLCDISALAVESTKATLAANNLQASVIASNVYSEITEPYQAIITNPPFHSGLDTHYQAAEHLITQAPKYLERGGRLCLVANRFLKYPELLDATFGEFSILQQTNKFTLYHAHT